MANGSDEADEQSGVVRLRVEFPKVDRYEFEKPKSKNFKKMTDPPKRMVGGSRFRQHGGCGADIAVIERKNLKRDR